MPEQGYCLSSNDKEFVTRIRFWPGILLMGKTTMIKYKHFGKVIAAEIGDFL